MQAVWGARTCSHSTSCQRDACGAKRPNKKVLVAGIFGAGVAGAGAAVVMAPNGMLHEPARPPEFAGEIAGGLVETGGLVTGNCSPRSLME